MDGVDGAWTGVERFDEAAGFWLVMEDVFSGEGEVACFIHGYGL